MDLTGRLTGAARNVGAAAANGYEVLRHGGLETGELASEFTVHTRRPMFRLRRYFPDSPGGAPVMLIPPLMMSADVYDVSPATSAVGLLHAAGHDPWVVDFGAPERERDGLRRTVPDHVLAVSEAVDLVRAETGRDVHLAGYSQGGMFAYQVAAYRRSDAIASLITFGAPVDSRATRIFGVGADEVVSEVAALLADHVLVHLSLPAWASRLGFRLLDPVKSTRNRIAFLLQLHDRDALLPRERQRQFLDNTGYVAYPGPAIADLVKQFVAHNRMLSGGFVIDGVMSTLADISCPVLAFVGTHDAIAPAGSVRAIARAAPWAPAYIAEVRTGHFGMVVGTGAARSTWPRVANWVEWRERTDSSPSVAPEGVAPDGPVPDGIAPLDADDEPAPSAPLRAGVDLAGFAAAAARTGLGTAASGARAATALAGTARQALPRLARLESTRPSTRVSLAGLLDQRAHEHGGEPFFVFDGRAHTYADAKARIDAVVRGLFAAGVRPGERVGVLMGTRPSALTAVCALNRIGAVAVLLRPDGALEAEVRLGEATRIVADPDHAAAAQTVTGRVLVLGGGTGPRTLDAAVIDLERTDPDAVVLPATFEANPGRAGEPAFVLFTGEGAAMRVTTITNGQWARAAYGTASAARLGRADTVYAVAPVHHGAGLLTAVGGAVAGGARLALATAADPETFWAEVRRYGVTVVAYAWTLLRDLIEAENAPAERHHPVRLFVGSGMPTWLWRRSLERFPTAGVLEFFAATEENVVLANVSGRKVGAKGRPLPGSAEVAVLGFDPRAGELIRGPDGLARICAADEAGLLMARSARSDPRADRGVLAAGDAWVSTGHLFRRDAEGDHWLVAALPDLVVTAAGVLAPGPAEDALGALGAVDLVAGYPGAGAAGAELHVAVALRAGQDLTGAQVSAALAELPAPAQPVRVRVVPAIPVSTWWRPRRAELAACPTLADWVRAADGEYRSAPRRHRH